MCAGRDLAGTRPRGSGVPAPPQRGRHGSLGRCCGGCPGVSPLSAAPAATAALPGHLKRAIAVSSQARSSPCARAAQERTVKNDNRNSTALQREAKTHVALYILIGPAVNRSPSWQRVPSTQGSGCTRAPARAGECPGFRICTEVSGVCGRRPIRWDRCGLRPIVCTRVSLGKPAPC